MPIDEKLMTPRMYELWYKMRLLATYDPNLTVFGSGSHKYRLYPCLTELEVREFEQEHGVTLPEDYRRFVLEIGDGGAGPNYGLHRLQSPRRSIPPLLSQPWPHRTEWNLKSDQFGSIQEFNLEYEREEHTQGALAISEMGCGYNILLVVSGEERGTIWQDLRAGDGGILPMQNIKSDSNRMSFSEWYEDWLDKSLASE